MLGQNMMDLRNKIREVCDVLQARYCRLLLLTGNSANKNALADQCAEYTGCKTIKLGLQLSQELLNIPSKQRPGKTNELISGFIDEALPVYFSDIEILFDKNLKNDPIALFKFISRNRIVIVNWPGDYNSSAGTIVYANNESSEYYETQLDKEIICIDENGLTSMNFEYNGGSI